MKRGCTAMMLKQKCSRCSGWENHRHVQKKSTSESLKCEGDVDSFFFDWTVNKEFYLKVIKRLREAVHRKRPWKAN